MHFAFSQLLFQYLNPFSSTAKVSFKRPFVYLGNYIRLTLIYLNYKCIRLWTKTLTLFLSHVHLPLSLPLSTHSSLSLSLSLSHTHTHTLLGLNALKTFSLKFWISRSLSLSILYSLHTIFLRFATYTPHIFHSNEYLHSISLSLYSYELRLTINYLY